MGAVFSMLPQISGRVGPALADMHKNVPLDRESKFAKHSPILIFIFAFIFEIPIDIRNAD